MRRASPQPPTEGAAGPGGPLDPGSSGPAEPHVGEDPASAPWESGPLTGRASAGAPPEHDHFVPPPPPPLPRLDPVSRAAWAGVLGGPLLAILAVLTGFALDGWVGLVATAAFMGGFVTLVARMGDGPPPDLGGDDGAVV
ncbi:MAG: hypothetical protein M3Q27_12055 [Actinomycetota bacterium]|nr:hypothetical protein [Actinomycetota bacterium]